MEDGITILPIALILPSDERLEEIIRQACKDTGLSYEVVKNEFERLYGSEESLPIYQLKARKLDTEYKKIIKLSKPIPHYRDIEFKGKNKRF